MVRSPSSSATPVSACIPTKRRTSSAEGSKSQSSAALHTSVSSSSRGAMSAGEMFRRSTIRWSGDSSHAAIAAYIMSERVISRYSKDAVPGRSSQCPPVGGRRVEGLLFRDQRLDSQHAQACRHVIEFRWIKTPELLFARDLSDDL